AGDVCSGVHRDTVNNRAFFAGDQVFFKAGGTFTGPIIPLSSTGTSSSPVLFSSYSTGSAPVINSGAGNYGIYIHNMGGIKISNLTFTGSGTGTTVHGIYFYNNAGGSTQYTYAYIDNVIVTGYSGNGIYFYGASGTTGFTDVTII